MVVISHHVPTGERNIMVAIATIYQCCLLYTSPMDDCLCRVALDFGGRAWLVWDAEFHREKIGEMPTEMFLHFFKSLLSLIHIL